jgi:hypothetical protein
MKNTLQMYKKNKSHSTNAACNLHYFNSFLEFHHLFLELFALFWTK